MLALCVISIVEMDMIKATADSSIVAKDPPSPSCHFPEALGFEPLQGSRNPRPNLSWTFLSAETFDSCKFFRRARLSARSLASIGQNERSGSRACGSPDRDFRDLVEVCRRFQGNKEGNGLVSVSVDFEQQSTCGRPPEPCFQGGLWPSGRR